MHLRIIACVLALISLSADAQPTRGWLTVETIMQDPVWMGTSPSSVRWSDDGRWVYFQWRTADDQGDSLYKVAQTGGTPERVSFDERRSLTPERGSFTKDRNRKVFERDGDLFLADIRRNSVRQLTYTTASERWPSFSFDERSVLYTSGNDLFSIDLPTGQIRQMTNFQAGSAKKDEKGTDLQEHLKAQQMELFEVLRERKNERDRNETERKSLRITRPKEFYTGKKSVYDLQLSPDARYVTFQLTQAASGYKQTIVPSYVTESGFTEDIPARTKVGEPMATAEFLVYDRERDTVLAVDHSGIAGMTDSTDGKKKVRNVWYDGPHWSDDGTGAFVQLYSHDNKDRWIVRFDPATGTFGQVLDHQHDEAWIGGPGSSRWSNAVGWMPDSRNIWFQSEEDGWAHLYTVRLDGSNKRQLTQGAFEVYEPFISRDKKRWYFSSNEVHYGERHFYSMPIDGGKRTKITTMEGRNDVLLSPDEERMVIRFSSSTTMPDLFVSDNDPGASLKRITSSHSERFNAYDWRAPSILTIRARDGAEVPARLYTPDKPNGAAVVFVHGAGYLQNAHKWWSSYFREYMFHNLLADKGYTVLDIDYRGSAGLGRDWRTAIYRFMGGKDLDDQVDGARWLVANQGIDSSRIGIYGGSYGGFITFMAMFTAPGVFAAGASLRPVSDWAHYNHGYTSNILNIPQEDTIAYRRSSPIYHVEGFEGALLICHGMIDTNVHFQDAVRVVQRLIELKKENWELAVYPLESHGFQEPTSWMDEYKRILKLFEEHL